MKERLLALLGNRVSNAIAASAVGCTESYVTQLMANEEFAEEVSALRFNNLQAASARDTKMDGLEDKLLIQLEAAIPMLMRPGEIAKVASMVNGMKRRGSSAPEVAHIHNQVINLFLPAVAAKKFQFSSNKEIVEVEGRALTTMPAAQLFMEAKNHAINQLPRDINSTAENTEATQPC